MMIRNELQGYPGWKILSKFFIPVAFFGLMWGLSGCATFYQKNLQFNTHIINGEFVEAQKVLQANRKMQKSRNRLLYLMNSGWLERMLGNYEASNRYFNGADTLIEDLVKKPAAEALALIINPTVTPYEPEDFEKVFVNYFKALNFLEMGLYNEALVECRRITNLLYALNDKYKDKKNRYSNDAFANLMIGLIYDATGDYNNAFIAYRNSLNIYDSVYVRNFGVAAPEQLKKDLIRTAYLSGLIAEAKWYESKFGIINQPSDNTTGDLVFLWQNGFGPVKAEWSVNFTQLPGADGFVNFTSEELGITFPVYIGDRSAKEKQHFSDLKFIRVAFPKYVERKPFYHSARITVTNGTQELLLAQDVNAIAFKTLQDRMMREMGESLARLAAKQVMEAIAREQNKDAGAVVSILNAITEQADTRNWQTLPYSVSYARIPLQAGLQKITLEPYNAQTTSRQQLEVEIRKGNTSFMTFQTIE